MTRIGFISSEFKASTQLSTWLQSFAQRYQYEFETTFHFSSEYSELRKVWALIDLCDLLVADVTDNDPNVIYEIGLAHGVGKPVILFTQSKHTLPPVFLGQELLIYDLAKPESTNLEYKLKQIIEKTPRGNRLRGPRDEDSVPTVSKTATSHNFRDIFALTGAGRSAQFEQWFYSLISQIPGWEIHEQKLNYKDKGYDFIVWNNFSDSEFSTLGNPIAIELKTGEMNLSMLEAILNNADSQQIKGIIIATLGRHSTWKRKIKEFYKSKDLVTIVLNRDDLIEVNTPHDMFALIRNKLSDFLYSGANSV